MIENTGIGLGLGLGSVCIKIDYNMVLQHQSDDRQPVYGRNTDAISLKFQSGLLHPPIIGFKSCRVRDRGRVYMLVGSTVLLLSVDK